MHRGSSKILEKMLKTCLVPQNMFYFSKKDNNNVFEDKKEKIENMLKERMNNNNNKKIKTVEIENEILIFKDNISILISNKL